MSDPEALLELAIEAARLGGGLLAERAAGGAESSVASKSTPTDLVSEADVASQRAIRELLREHRPEDGFLGEEEGESEAGTSGLRWIVDPLDGTVNFLFGIPQWSVSVAVADEDGTLAGAVYDPNREELFLATRGGPALMRTAAGAVELDAQGLAVRRAVLAHDDLANAMVATGLSYGAAQRAREAAVVASLAPHVRDIRRFGSAALDLAWTAAGRYDAYFDRSIQIWDIAAGRLICERARLDVRELPEVSGMKWGVLAARMGLADQLAALICEQIAA